MFKPLNLIFNPVIDTKNEDLKDIQQELVDLVQNLNNIQGQLFTVEYPAHEPATPVVDHLLYVDRAQVGVSSDPSLLTSPTPVGIGRELKNKRVLLSTLFHVSPSIKLGKSYTFAPDGAMIELPESQNQSTSIKPLYDGLGIILWENILSSGTVGSQPREESLPAS